MTCTCHDDWRALNFETMLTDPLIQMVMESDGVSLPELIAVLEAARGAVVAREALAAQAAFVAAVASPPGA
ncbi:MAG TPA: hypothetical protein VGH36_13250 [Acetobacteraceae bacterium]